MCLLSEIMWNIYFTNMKLVTVKLIGMNVVTCITGEVRLAGQTDGRTGRV